MLPSSRPGTSPFLPNSTLQFAWDSTSLTTFKDCARKYQYSMIEGWTSKGQSIHLTFGIWYHSAIELYEKLWVQAPHLSHDEILREVVLWLLKETWIEGKPWDPYQGNKTANYKSRSNLIRSVIWYLDQFGENDSAETYVLPYGRPAVELSFRMELDLFPGNDGGQPYLLCGHLDRIVSFGGELYGMDHKTTTYSLGQPYFDNFEPDNQMTIYTIACETIFSTPVRGIIIDAAQLLINETKFARGFTYRTSTQIEEWLTDLGHWLGLAELFAREGHYPMNDAACGKYGGCPFRSVCSKSPEVRHLFLEANFDRSNPWNPLLVR